MAQKIESCENCGRVIGELEQACVYDDHIVCKQCREKLQDVPERVGTSVMNACQTGSTILTKPGKVTAIGGMRMGAGVCNIIAGLVFCWLLLPLVMIPLGVIEIVSASNLLKSRPNTPSGLKTIAILEIVAILTLAGWISVVVGIITLAFLSDQRVQEYFSQL